MAVQLVITPNYAFGAGEFQPGARAFTYESGTTTPFIVYADEALTTPHPQPIVADASGSFPTIWSDAANDVKAVVTAADGSSLFTIDKAILGNVEIGQASDLGFAPITNNTATDAQTAIANNSDAIADLETSPGRRILLDTLNLEEFQFSEAPTSATRYDFPLFDPTRFIGYEWEFVSLQVFNSESILLPQVTTDGGATYAGGHTIRTLVDDGSGGPSSSTGGTGTFQNGASASGISSQSGHFRLMRPDLPYLTNGEFAIHYSVGSDGIGVQSGLYQHNTAVAIDGLGFATIHQCLQGFIYMYGILG